MVKLDGPRLKIARADEHYKSFKVELGRFLRSKPYAVVSEFDAQSGEKIWHVHGQPREPPPRLSLIAGDVLHNLRSALDYLAWQLVLANGRQPGTGTAFPIFNSVKLFEGERSRRKMMGMSEAAVARIKGPQPCYGRRRYRDRMLWLLEELDNIDKHRHLHLTAIAGIGGFWSPGLPVRGSRSFIHMGPIEDGTVLARLAAEHMNVDSLLAWT